MGHDPIALRILWDKLISITQETSAALVRTAFSSVVREGNDYAVVLMDARGNSVAQPWHCPPSFLGTLPITARHLLRRFPPETLRPGDSLVTNDPWLGTGHLPDLTIVTPIFGPRGELVALAGVIAHMADIGGIIDYGGTREVYEEGIRIPMVRLAREGSLDETVLEFIRNNVRVPEDVVGDINAMLAANWVASERVRQLMIEERIEDFTALADEILSRTEGAMREAIRAAPAGVYASEVSLDGLEGSITLRVRVEIAGDTIHVDFAGSSPQNHSSLNSVISYTYAYTAYPLKCLLNPSIPNNEGCYRPITVAAPEGCVLNAKPPAAVMNRNQVGHFIPAAIFSALAEVFPDRVMAHSGSTPVTLEAFAGTGRDGSPYVLLVGFNGGSGAAPGRDGRTSCFPSNMSNTPAEVIELTTPLLVEEKVLIPDSGGPGKFRGGPGQRITIRNLANTPVLHNLVVNRLNHPAQGLLGGRPGRPNRLFLNGRPLRQTRSRLALRPGDAITVEYPGGGGLYPPADRDRDRVERDVRDGLVTPRAAALEYQWERPLKAMPARLPRAQQGGQR